MFICSIKSTRKRFPTDVVNMYLPDSAYARRVCNAHSQRPRGPTVWRAAATARNCKTGPNKTTASEPIRLITQGPNNK